MIKKWWFLCLLAAGVSLAGADLIHEEFASSKPGADLPAGWRRYGAVGTENFTKVIQVNGKNALRIYDMSEKETGIYRDFPVKPGKYYQGTVTLAQQGKVPPQDVIRLQIRFVPKSGKATWAGGALKNNGTTVFGGYAPENTQYIRIYIYTSFGARMDAVLHSFRLEELDKAPAQDGNPRQGFVPSVEKLKDMCRMTPLDQVTILAGKRYAGDAARIADAIAKATGTRPRMLPDTATVPGHKILLGNRDTNERIEYLYRRYFAYTDIVYPGKGGYELRTVHNPFGNKENYILVGGSDDAGVTLAADRLIALAGKKVLGPVIDVRSFPDLPKDIKSTRYHTQMAGSFPGYGWNTLSWLLEMYYRSGDAKYAREFIQLGIHTKRSDMPRLKEVNAESFWDFSQPLSTPYHYMGHYIVLLWDLVEEQDVFTDAERLAVTRALAKQIRHPDINMCYRHDIKTAAPVDIVGDRHAQWSVMMMFALARYMQRDYPHPVWERVILRAEHFHEPIFRAGTWGGASSTFSWFASSMLNEPAQFLMLTGKTDPHPEGMLMNAVKVYEIMWDPGRDAAANGTMSSHNHRLLATLTGDDKFNFYGDDIELKWPTQKLGQSFRSAKAQSRIPSGSIGRWIVAQLPEATCKRRNLPQPYSDYALNTGYRDSMDRAGDRVMFDLYNELGRRPYQLNVLYYLRIAGKVYLAGYENNLQVVRNGVAAPHIPTNGRLRKTGVNGSYVYHASAVPDMAHAEWERILVLKKRNAALIADRITAKEDGPLQVALNWSMPSTTQPKVLDNRISFLNTGSIAASSMEITADGPVKAANAARVAMLKKKGDVFRATFPVNNMFRGDLLVRMVRTTSGAPGVDLALDGKTMARDVAMDTAGPDTVHTVTIPNVELAPGKHTLTFTLARAGSETNAVQLWRVYFAEKGKESCIAGAGLEAGRNYHKGSLPFLKKGDSHTFFTIFGQGVDAVRTVGHPDASLLYLPEKTLAFSGEFKPFGKGRLVWVDARETMVMDDRYQVTVRPTSAEAAAALKALKNAPVVLKSAAALPQVKARHTVDTGVRFSHAEPVMFRGKPALLAGGGNQVRVISGDGKILLKLQIPGRVMSLHGTGKMLIVGTMEDKVYAYNEEGKLLWTHVSICATPFEKQKHYYWYKGACPGVYAVSSMAGDIYTGGACTVERISADGKVIKRYEQLWGTQSLLLPLIRKDGSMRMLSARHRHASGSQIYAVDPVSNTIRLMYAGTKAGFRDFPGFASLLRTHMILQDVDQDGRQELVTATAGMYSWIQISDDQGKILHQVNLGGKPELTDLAAADDLVVGVDPLRRMIILDGKLQPRTMVDLPDIPKKVLAGREILLLDGCGVTVYDRTGKALRQMRVYVPRLMVQLADGTVCVTDSKGKVHIY